MPLILRIARVAELPAKCVVRVNHCARKFAHRGEIQLVAEQAVALRIAGKIDRLIVAELAARHTEDLAHGVSEHEFVALLPIDQL